VAQWLQKREDSERERRERRVYGPQQRETKQVKKGRNEGMKEFRRLFRVLRPPTAATRWRRKRRPAARERRDARMDNMHPDLSKLTTTDKGEYIRLYWANYRITYLMQEA